MKKFLISIDTEGDNLWSWKNGDKILTNNSKFLSRFQKLCDYYSLKPTYLTNYEMAKSSDFQKFVDKYCDGNNAEIGMHLHSWNTPPNHLLKNNLNEAGAPYLIEYPLKIMEEKIATMSELLVNTFGSNIVTHRAGRWAMNDDYFSLLYKYGYKYDCSVTPHINWKHCVGGTEGSGGTNYSMSKENPYFVGKQKKSLLEVPVTVRCTSHYFPPNKKTVKGYLGAIYRKIQKENIWLRPTGNNTNKMIWLIDHIANDSTSDYIMFMLHSSELMPGGSPTFTNEQSIENLYIQLETIFKHATNKFEGATIGEFGKWYSDNK